MRIFYTSLLTMLFFSLTSYPQINNLLINSGEIINKGIELNRQGNYDEAIGLFTQVTRNDTNYALALSELASSYLKKKEYNRALQTSKEGLLLSSEYDLQFYNAAGNAYDEMDSTNKALFIYNEGLKKYPFSYILCFNIAIAYNGIDSTSKAIFYLQKAIDINIFYAPSHYLLGIIYANRGQIIPSMLALEMFLVLEPSTTRSQIAIGILEDIAQGSLKSEKLIEKSKIKEDKFEELELIINSKIALDKKYKSQVTLYDPLIKQLQLQFERLTYNEKDNGFCMKNYVPFFKNLYTEGYLVPFTYYLFASVGHKDIDKWLKKNMSKIKGFTAWANTQLNMNDKIKPVEIDGKILNLYHWYYNNWSIHKVGNYKKNKNDSVIYNDVWKFFYSTGGVNLTCKFSDNGKREGKWVWNYPNGKLKEITNYENGYSNGNYENYHTNGEISQRAFYKKDTLNGDLEQYYESGQLNFTENYVNGKREGKSIFYHKNGDKYYDIFYKNNLFEGEMVEYYPGGNKKAVTQMHEGLRSGNYTGYFNNGKTQMEGNYNKDKENGLWKWYYENDQLQSKTNYDTNGVKNGEVKIHFENGNLSQEYIFKNGSINGAYTSFDEDGKLHYRCEYKDGKIIKFEFYDKQGNIIASGIEKKNKLNYFYYSPSGDKKSQGNYVNGKMEGAWSFFYPNGQLSSEEIYANDLNNGLVKWYNKNGQFNAEIKFVNNQKEGFYKRFYKNGKLNQEGWYKNGAEQGNWYTYQTNGNLSTHNYFVNGELDGYQVYYRIDGSKEHETYIKNDMLLKVTYFDTSGNVVKTNVLKNGNGTNEAVSFNGVKTSVGVYKNGIAQGEFKWFFTNGKASSSTFYYNDKKTGKHTGFHENGKLAVEGNYENDLKTGTWIWYYPNGKVETTGPYKKGERDGLAVWYNKNGNKDFEINYDNGERHGEVLMYNEKGDVMVKKLYDHGTLKSFTFLDKNNNYVEPVILKNETCTLTSYYSNGQKSLEQIYEYGFLEGSYITYHPNGNIASERNFINNEEEGLRKEYFENGKIKSEENYYYDQKHGVCKYFSEKGHVEHEEVYYLGEKHGTWDYYDEHGKSIKKILYLYNLSY